MVATDMASRGLDVPDITHVFNYDLPKGSLSLATPPPSLPRSLYFPLSRSLTQGVAPCRCLLSDLSPPPPFVWVEPGSGF